MVYNIRTVDAQSNSTQLSQCKLWNNVPGNNRRPSIIVVVFKKQAPAQSYRNTVTLVSRASNQWRVHVP